MSTVSEPKSKPCNRCGEQIIWNAASHFYESIAYPKYQHCCKLVCNKAGCGGSIYFSKLCPVNEVTGNPRPLDFPVPQIDPNNPAQMLWIVHVHKVSVPTEPAPPTPQQTAEVVQKIQETTVPLAPGQETLVANIQATDTPNVQSRPVAQNPISQNPIAQTGNQDAQAAILTTLNQINQRMGALEKYFNDVVPTLTGMMDVMNAIMPKLNVIVGKIAAGSITSASDLVKQNLSEKAEQNLQ
jgi:hypothetical protein